ncbi:MAG: hypothetical protein MK183_06060 [Verrucomicrobiales bacterium]|nr:hypothetical protein [Verrucomicrobiales bacterium]MED5587159.1 hypothetical protein [Verrucomicrobiota bacterium]
MKLLRIFSLIAAASGFLILGACKSNEAVAPIYAEPDAAPGAVAPGAYIDSGK